MSRWQVRNLKTFCSRFTDSRSASDAGEGAEGFGARNSGAVGSRVMYTPGNSSFTVIDEVGEGLVVLQADVEPRVDVLDQAVLGEQGFPLAFALDDVEVVDDVEQALLLEAQVGRGDEIARDAIGEAGGFADVLHDAPGVLHEVDAGCFRQAAGLFQELVEFVAVGHGSIAEGGDAVTGYVLSYA